MGFDHLSDFEQGREDALNGFPRASTRAHYRAGYDRGLSQAISRQKEEVREGGLSDPRPDPVTQPEYWTE